MDTIDTTILNQLIVGRVEPHIYAFSTESIPNYLKVGDTYRPVAVRLNEWRRFYPNLEQRYVHIARLPNGSIFRDYAVHTYLEKDKGHKHLLEGEISVPYYSREFFKDVVPEEINEAIADIQRSAEENDGKYQFYSPDLLPVTYSFKRSDIIFKPRPNQDETIERFVTAVKNGRTNLLMYAVMRFGKSFTALCCADKINASLIVVVSAKADVKNEWKKNVEVPKNFVNYIFLDSTSLLNDEKIIKSTIEIGKKAVVFLTLQDLQGDEIKAKHKEIFENQVDLLIIDETHFGARAAEYGKVLVASGVKQSLYLKEMKDGDFADEYDECHKAFNAKVRLHLSGTPYRILMGDEFTREDIIAFYQFSDVVDAQEAWNNANLCKDNVKEWDNPYYGFPQMIRFAFTLNKSARLKLEELRRQGITYAFSELFRPKSLVKASDGKHKQFIHKDEILELFKVIDGVQDDDELLGFLNLPQIKQGKMCRHIVCVLPYRASCDSLETLLKDYSAFFLNLAEYEIINISGVDNEKLYPDTNAVKQKITSCEKNNRRTITLTVNRMLTGSTVEEWDTMLYFKDTASPQEYDQAIFRIQNQYIKSFIDENGEIVQYNMKPQTLLVDFDPARLFRLQELKSQFYNVNVEQNGNLKLEERIRHELQISPVIALNKGKLHEVTPANIMDAVRNYSQNKSIRDEATDIPFDANLLEIDEIKAAIDKLKTIDDNKGFDIQPVEGDEDIITPPHPEDNGPQDGGGEDDSSKINGKDDSHPLNEDENVTFQKKLATYYSQILFFAYLTDTEVKSLEEIIASIPNNENNQRIAKNVGLKISILSLIQKKCNPFILSKLDYKIQNINSLMRDTGLSPLERAQVAMKKFSRFSESEVVTPHHVTMDLVNLLPTKEMSQNYKILDIASLQGEFTCTLCQKFGDGIKRRIYALPTSRLSYELTRKIYSLLGIPLDHIIHDFTTYNLLGEDREKLIEKVHDLHPDVIIGNPPYNYDGKIVYGQFVEIAKSINPRFISMLIKANWYSGGLKLDDFRNSMLSEHRIRIIHDYPDPDTYFKGPTTLRGGICYFLWDSEYDGKCLIYNHINGNTNSMKRFLREGNIDIFIRYNLGISILKKVSAMKEESIMEKAFTRNAFKLGSNNTEYKLQASDKACYKLYLPREKQGYFTREQIPHNFKVVLQWKVLVAKASPGDDTIPHGVISHPIVSEPNSLCTDSHLVVRVMPSEIEAKNLAGYMSTKFFRFMMLLAKNNQNMTREIFRFVPVQDFSKKWTDEKLFKKYGFTDEEIAFINLVIKDWRN
ncbi:MAG: Eco57I restriction-modification methylase domain-containing protein [Victivallales bacterium]|nr:Eco57I restriction-modification methylase domain-containing protein [Victivallales bacterium]